MIKTPSNYVYQNKFWTLSGVLASLVFCYLSLVGMTVSNTLDRQRTEKQINELQGTVSELEFSYISINSSMTLDKAKSLGFVEMPDFLVARNASDNNVAISE